ncbi:MAG: dCTP deaminase [Lentisphaerae bacterium]|nr:dCTP deaminase [Lentisphaerota bacterium]
MILSNQQIRKAVQGGKIRIKPSPEALQYAPSALDLRIGHEFLLWKKPSPGVDTAMNLSTIKVTDCQQYVENLPPERDGTVRIKPNQFVLAKTLEEIDLSFGSKLAARIEGRSSYARLGLTVHMTAPTIHCGFHGTITLEMMNFGPYTLILEPGKTCVCQLIFEELGAKPTGKFDSLFLGQNTALGHGKR